ncbi:hypothetical protein [Ureibacillus endophyticus]|uniref:Uncharacterized protein n=1 Tax=Ureibacillus endophyticus TaxID=1978490 RepID=A0A494YTJ0_9BACL|nr:hypothetical protein [Lysinibacillus endophyticus]RKQ13451.1 hypothetical protein D8M03_16080 [Lysinibacillus endophyticus]
MFFKRSKIEVVPVSEYTDYSERFAEFEKMREVDRKQYATRKTVAIASTVTATASVGLVTYNQLSSNMSATIPVYETVSTFSSANTAPVALSDAYTPLQVTATTVMPEPTGIIADASLTALATVLDPIIDIMIALSFPLASVIMIGAGFFFMLGQSERAWDIIFKCGLGYLFIQLAPLLLEILKTVGNTI